MLKGSRLLSGHHNGCAPMKILVRRPLHCYGSVFDYQVFHSLVLAELQLLFERPIFQPLSPVVALVKKIFRHLSAASRMEITA